MATHTPAQGARHSPRRYRLLLEALGALAAASIAVRFLPFKRAVRTGASRSATAGPSGAILAEISWAVRKASQLSPWRTVCIQRGIALQRMLRRRGVDARLHYGVRRDESEAIAAHVWITAEHDVLMGGAEAHLFQPVATFP